MCIPIRNCINLVLSITWAVGNCQLCSQHYLILESWNQSSNLLLPTTQFSIPDIFSFTCKCISIFNLYIVLNCKYLVWFWLNHYNVLKCIIDLLSLSLLILICMSHLYRLETSIQISFLSIFCIAIHVGKWTSILISNFARTVTKQKLSKHIFIRQLLSHHYCYPLLPTNQIGTLWPY